MARTSTPSPLFSRMGLRHGYKIFLATFGVFLLVMLLVHN
jgi:hypothetical protein